MQIYDMKVNHLTNPLGFYMNRTVFTWKVKESAGKGQQWARIRIALDPEMTQLLYDSGADPKADSLGTRVDLPLSPRTRWYWTVTVHTDAGEETDGPVQWFETAKEEEPWRARWITCDNSQDRHPIFSKEIVPCEGKNLLRARLYICGLGLYEAFYNGVRIGNEYLTPYSNDYKEWIQYQTFDVTEALQQAGTLSIHLGNGWYKGRFGYWTAAGTTAGFYGSEWKLLAELVLDYTDGTSRTIGTDDSWTVTRSSITFSNLYDGEWRDDTLPAAPAEQAVLCPAPDGELSGRLSLPVTPQEIIKPARLIHTPAGEQVLDLGQEITGIFRLHVQEPAGTRIHIQTGEILQGGNFYRDNLRTALSEYYYTSDGSERIIEPHFTFYGYRYVKVEGVSHLEASDFEGIVLHSEMERTGFAQTGHAPVNRLIENVLWGMKCNFLDVPTDCPQRDERLGWTGDAQTFAPTATYLYDTYAFYTKYLCDMAKEQKSLGGMIPDFVPSYGKRQCACVWGDASCIIPWHLYVVYGDRSILEDQFESMKAWVEYIRRVDGEDHGWRRVFHYGDWLALDKPGGGAEQTKGATDEEFIASIYYANSADIVAKSAAVLGRTEDAEEYRALAQQLFLDIRREYYSATGRCCIKTQTALLLTLRFHLSDNVELTRQQLAELFKDYDGKLTTGFVGTPILCNVLSDNDMSERAFSLLLNEDYPGWIYEVNLGATTVWERWNSLLPDGTISGTSMNSMNHYAYGSILEWIFRHVAGINIMNDEPGTRHMELIPTLELRLGKAGASYDSPAGTYTCSWELADARHVTIRCSVPFGCSADLRLPLAPQSVYEDASNPLFTVVRDGICHLEPGSYEVTYELTQSLGKNYSLDTPIRELMQDPDIMAKLSRVLPLGQVPHQYHDKSIRELVSLFNSNLSQEQLEGIERLLSA